MDFTLLCILCGITEPRLVLNCFLRHRQKNCLIFKTCHLQKQSGNSRSALPFRLPQCLPHKHILSPNCIYIYYGLLTTAFLLDLQAAASLKSMLTFKLLSVVLLLFVDVDIHIHANIGHVRNKNFVIAVCLCVGGVHACVCVCVWFCCCMNFK